MIPTYNCYDHLKVALGSVLEQDMGPEKMQIQVVDDFSTDGDVEALVQEMGKGRVEFYRQPRNRGSLRNFETCINHARGHYVHILHGDDALYKGYYAEIEMLFNKFPEAGAAFTGLEYINQQGAHISVFKREADDITLLTDMLYRLTERLRMQYVCVTVKRSVYEELGSFFGVTYGEDWEMWTRISTKYPFAYSPRIFARYREHGTGSISSNSFKTGQNFRDINWVLDQITTYLPKHEQQKRNRLAKSNYMYWAAGAAYRFWYFTQDSDILKLQLNTIKSLYSDPRILLRIQRILLRMHLQPYKNRIKKTIRRR